MISEATVTTVDVTCHGELLIGRLPPAEIELGGATVSRRHCWMRVDDAGAVTVEDAGSTGGIFVNRARAWGTQALGLDDELRIGAYTLRLVGPPRLQGR